MFSADILVLADIPTAVYRPLLTVRAQSLTKDLRNHLTLYTLSTNPMTPKHAFTLLAAIPL